MGEKINREESRRHLNAANETRGIFIRILISIQISDDFPGNAISRSRRTIGRIEGPEGMKFRAKGFVHEMWLVRVQVFRVVHASTALYRSPFLIKF